MIFVMDIGNTNIKAAVFEGKKLLKRWRCATDPSMTSDQYGIIMSDLFRYHELSTRSIEGIMISSVVPTINFTIEHMCRDYFGQDPRILVPGMKTGLNIKYENPRELGSDRIANAVAAYALGIVSGRGNGVFDPYATITRQEAAAFLMRSAKVLGMDTSKVESASFADSDKVGVWFTDAVNFVYQINVMSGTGSNKFSPLGTYTREQSYIAIYRLFQAVMELNEG